MNGGKSISGPSYIPFSIYEPTHSIHQHQQQQPSSSHISRSNVPETAPPLKRSLKSSINNKSSARVFERKPAVSNKPRSMSVNSKKVVRFADSLGLELESFIPFSHANHPQYAKTHHYQFYQHNPAEFVNANSHQSAKAVNHDGNVNTNNNNNSNYAYVNSRNNYLNKVHSVILMGNNNNSNNSKQPPLATSNKPNFYEDVMNQLTLNTNNKGSSCSNNKTENVSKLERQYESILEQQFLQQQQQQNMNQNGNYMHQNANDALMSEIMVNNINAAPDSSVATSQSGYKISNHLAKSISSSNSNGNVGTAINSNQNVTIMTRINNGKLESEV